MIRRALGHDLYPFAANDLWSTKQPGAPIRQGGLFRIKIEDQAVESIGPIHVCWQGAARSTNIQGATGCPGLQLNQVLHAVCTMPKEALV